jgi:glycosyltransferase involved in cell wall biosynthesis
VRAGRHGVIRQAAEAVRVGFYAPMPPARTGVADYAAALLVALERRGEVRIAPSRCDVALYHVGNNRLHAEIYRRALAEPGVVVLHDAVLNHFLLGQLSRQQYIEEFVYNYGGRNRGLAEGLWESRSGSATDGRYFQFPMLRRIAERSRAVIVHNPAAARRVREHAARARVIEIPHLFCAEEMPGEAEVARYRTRLGFGETRFVFGVFGFLRESKRVAAVLEVFARLRRERRDVGLLVAGAFVSADLERMARSLVESEGVVCRSYLSTREFRLAARAVDACINLRYPAAGETSGIAIRMMGIGKPVLVTDSEECARLPEGGCVRVEGGIAERDSLWSHMVLLTSLPGVGRAIGERGAAHVRARHDLEQVADRYWSALCESRC